MAGAGAQAATEEGAAPFLSFIAVCADEGPAHMDKHWIGLAVIILLGIATGILSVEIQKRWRR